MSHTVAGMTYLVVWVIFPSVQITLFLFQAGCITQLNSLGTEPAEKAMLSNVCRNLWRLIPTLDSPGTSLAGIHTHIYLNCTCWSVINIFLRKIFSSSWPFRPFRKTWIPLFSVGIFLSLMQNCTEIEQISQSTCIVIML